MDRKFVFLLVVAVISISAKVNQKKKCREMCESNKYCKSWKYNEKTNKCKISIKKGGRRPRTSVPCETATKCEKMYESNIEYCESWKFNKKTKRCTMFFNQDMEPVVEPGCTQDVVNIRCNTEDSGIPSEIQDACSSIGLGLIEQYTCTHEAGDLSNRNKQTCCRDVVLNLCNGSPDEVQYGNMTIPVRLPCIESGYNDCLEKNCSINCVSKVLKEMCGSFSESTLLCNFEASLLSDGAEDAAELLGKTLGLCNEGTETRDICNGAVNLLCDTVDITQPPLNSTSVDICKNLGQNLCENN